METNTEFEIGPEKDTRYDAIVVHGYPNQKKTVKSPDGTPTSSRFEPVFDGKMRCIATAHLLINGASDTAIVSGGVTSKDPEAPSEAEAMRDFIQRYIDIEKGKLSKKIEGAEGAERQSILQKKKDRLENNIRILKEEDSIDTSTNLENTLEQIRQNGWKRVLFLSNAYHTKRIKQMAKAKDHDALVVPAAEDVLEDRSSKYSRIRRLFYRSPGMLKRKGIEAANRLILHVDPDAKFAKKMAETFRAQNS